MMLRIREENAKNLIFDFAEQLISENQDFIGQDIAEDAKVKVRRKQKEATKEGGKENVKDGRNARDHRRIQKRCCFY